MTFNQFTKNLTDKQTAELIGVSTSSIRRWVAAGTFPEPISLSAGCTRWRLSDIERWEEERAEEARLRSEAKIANRAAEEGRGA